MIKMTKHISLDGTFFPFGVVQVKFPPRKHWQEDKFRALVHSEIALLKEKFAEYDRKTVFGENPYFRFFKKFKKTYPVMLQFESVVFKDRPFPAFNPVSEIAFLMELTTFVLSGAHDIDCIDGEVQLYLAAEKEDFEGMRETLHTYPNDFCARDDSGIIFSLIAGTDNRTCAKNGSTNVFYPVFGTPDLDQKVIYDSMEVLKRYILTLAPDAEIETAIL